MPKEPAPTKLDPHILAAARKADPAASTAIRAAMTSRAAAEEAEAAAAAAEAAAGVVRRKTVIVNAAPKPRGHARKFTPALQRQYVELIAKAVTPAQAAAACGVSTATIKATQKADPEFADACKAARADAAAPIIEALYETALAGNFQAQKYLLENMDPENWRDPSKRIDVAVSGQIESTGPVDRTAQIERIRQLEERLAERLALRAAGDEIEAQIDEAELVDDAPQIEDAGDHEHRDMF